MNMVGIYKAMTGRLRQLSEPRLRQQARIEKSLTSVEKDILVHWVRKYNVLINLLLQDSDKPLYNPVPTLHPEQKNSIEFWPF